MSFSWIFGNKKKSPEQDGHSLAVTAQEADEFVLIEDKPPTQNFGYGSGKPVLPYSIASTSYTVQEPHSETTAQPPPNFLQGVPFKLSPEADFNILDTISNHSTRANNFLFYLSNRLDLRSFQYEFTVEKEVLREAGSRDLG